jgi:hypothetical protein
MASWAMASKSHHLELAALNPRLVASLLLHGRGLVNLKPPASTNHAAYAINKIWL